MEYYDPAAAGRPAPQLTRADLKRMTPEQIDQADRLGQFAVLKGEGRDPIGPEIRGERMATPEEAQAQRAEERAVITRAKHDQLIQARKDGLDA